MGREIGSCNSTLVYGLKLVILKLITTQIPDL